MSRRVTLTQCAIQAAAECGVDAHELLERKRTVSAVRARQRMWLILHDQHRWSYPEIAAATGWENSTISEGVRRARKLLEASA